MKKFLIILAVFIFGIFSHAEAADYNITKYHVYMTVNENNTFNILERITVDFLAPQHGIIRKIPWRNAIIKDSYYDNGYSPERTRITRYRTAEVKDIIIDNEKSSVQNLKNDIAIKIGDPEVTLTGLKSYDIEYLYNIGPDNNIGFDEFYFNIVGPNWDTRVDNIAFQIKMPKAFEKADSIRFYQGKPKVYGASRAIHYGMSYKVEGNTITGYYKPGLAPGEALTIQIRLPNNYFIGATNPVAPKITTNDSASTDGVKLRPIEWLAIIVTIILVFFVHSLVSGNSIFDGFFSGGRDGSSGGGSGGGGGSSW